MTAPLGERLRRLARWADRFVDPSFRLGSWVAPSKGNDGVTQLGWYDISAEGQQFVTEMYELGWVHDFDWMSWLGTPAARDLQRDPERVGRASADDLARLLTAIIRSERFGDGQIEGAFESGLLLAIARRARELSGSA